VFGLKNQGSFGKKGKAENENQDKPLAANEEKP
jgi:hypothetical protein